MPRLSSAFLRACAFIVPGVASGFAATNDAAIAEFHKTVQPLLVKYCYECHGDGAAKGKIAFDDMGTDAQMVASHEVWSKVLKNVRAGLMPKDDSPKPTADEIGQLERWVKFQAFGLDPANPDPGRVTVRRLNRVEYRNTIRDLMGTDFNSEVEFPPDDTGHGFDNLGEVLTVSPMLLEKYLQAAQEIVDQAVPRVAKVPAKLIALSREFRPVPGVGETAGDGKAPENAGRRGGGPGGAPGAGRGGRGGADLNARRGGQLAHTFELKQDGTYKFEFEANVRSTFDFDTGRGTLILSVDGEELERREIVWGAKPIKFEKTQDFKAGSHRVVVELQPLPPLEAAKTEAAVAAVAVPAVAAKTETDASPAAGAPATPAVVPVVSAALAVNDATPRAAGANAGADGAAAAAPGRGAGVPGAGRGRGAGRGAGTPPARSVDLHVVSAQFTGPMEEAHWVPTENYARFFSRETPPAALAERDAYAGEVLRTFATRAFRRPVDDTQVSRLVAIAHGVYAAPGAKFEDGIARAMMGLLASPRFLFRTEEPASTDAKKHFAQVDEYALASRLSYFLWSNMPDEELLRLAGRGELRQAQAAQVTRMLKDPKAQAFVRNFPGQWLQARDIETVPINARAVLGVGDARSNIASKTDLDSAMRKAMRSETEMTFDYVVREDRSVLEFIDADYTFLNAKLATHYGLPAVEGDTLQRVTLPPDSPRGGFLTQGTMLAVTSNPTRTSPVKRGLFVLENFLGTPPPPPPPDIPALDEAAKDADGKALTLREALAAHRDKPLCASCHARMDPLGFALENFNAMGMWRDVDARQPIDASGELATGEAFKDIRDVKRILTHERRLDYYRCLTEKMLTYALGRGLEYYDVETVDQIVDRLEKTQGRFSSLLNGIIESAPFQQERNPAAPAVARVTAISR